MTQAGLQRRHAQVGNVALLHGQRGTAVPDSNVLAIHRSPADIHLPVHPGKPRRAILLAALAIATTGLSICGWLAMNAWFAGMVATVDQPHYEPLRSLESVHVDILRLSMVLDHLSAEVEQLQREYDSKAGDLDGPATLPASGGYPAPQLFPTGTPSGS